MLATSVFGGFSVWFFLVFSAGGAVFFFTKEEKVTSSFLAVAAAWSPLCLVSPHNCAPPPLRRWQRNVGGMSLHRDRLTQGLHNEGKKQEPI